MIRTRLWLTNARRWDTKELNGIEGMRSQEVATGVYFYRIKAGEFTQSKKMVILK
jgi:hypothetical protein